MFKKENGVTMVTLVITIVCVLILATVTISYTLGEGELLDSSIDSVNSSRAASVQELFQYYVSNDYADDKDVFVDLIDKGYVKQLKDENDKVVFYITHEGINEIAPNFADTTSNSYIYQIVGDLSAIQETDITQDELEELKDADVYIVDREFNVAYFSNNAMYGDLIFSEEQSIVAVDKWWLSEDDVDEYEFKIQPISQNYLTYTINNGFATITGFNESYFKGSQTLDKDLAIPEKIIEGSGASKVEAVVNAIDRKAFAKDERTNINITKKVYIPSTVETIGEEAFKKQENISAVYISAKSIGNGAFKDCRNIQNVFITANTTQHIGDNAFENVSNSLRSITFPEGIVSIGRSAFKKCSSLGDLIFPSTLTGLGEEAFKECNNKAKKIDFSRCTLLKTIPRDTFRSCNSISELLFAEGLEIIGDSAFKDCRNCNVSDIYFPDSLREIGNEAFKNFKNINGTISINSSTNYDNAFDWWTSWWNVDERR